MKFTAFATFALFALASAELRKVPRSQKNVAPVQHVRRQDGGVNVQTAAMTTPDGGVVEFNTAGVHKQMTADGL